MGCEPELLKKEAKPTATRKLDLPEGVPPLTSLYMYISGSCNLACRHCWISPTYEPDNSKGQFLKLEYIKKAVREAKPLGLNSVKLTGGEPMLHPQIREIVEYLNSKDISIIMETNGTLINDEIARFLKSKSHFKFISVSVDGARAETHDDLRRVKGSFEQATSGIRALVKAGFHPQLICTLHKGNIIELEDLVDLAKDLGCGSVKFNHVQPMGRGDVFNRQHVLSVLELIRTFEVIENDLKSKYNIPIFFDIPIAFHSIKKMLKSSTCRCNVLEILGILANGKISLCGIGETTPELIFGDMQTDYLKDIWDSNKKLIEIREDVPQKIVGICAKCIHLRFCLGNCVASNYYRGGNFRASHWFCENTEKLSLFPKTRKKTEEVIYVKST